MNHIPAIDRQSAMPAIVESSEAERIQAAGVAKAGQRENDDQIFGPGLGILRQYMQLLNQLSNEHFQKMQKHGENANEAQAMVTEISALIADIDSQDKPGGTIKYSSTLQKYLKEHLEILKRIYPGLPNSGLITLIEKGSFTKQDLTSLSGEVQKYASENSDSSSRYQSQIQKTMQTYNVTVNLMNSLQTMLGDMTKQFAQAIR